ncbi:MAG: NAD(P)H-dependent glycerol-3-phosphate dehydrogenase [Actinomycetes bacterium]
MRHAVLGGGSWGTAFAMVLADAGAEVGLWTRESDVAESITNQHRNDRYHPGVRLPEQVWATTDPIRVLSGAEVVVLALPAQMLRVNLAAVRESLPADAYYVSLIKGIETGSALRMSEVIGQATGADPDQIAVLSGPNLAREIVQRQPAATTIACESPDVAQLLQEEISAPYFRPYWTTDVIGTEIGGAVKNVIALANGMAVGLGFGENAQAALITRGLAEMTRLGIALGADPLTFQGLAGVGDLVATCTSPLSRNRTFGENLGRGLSVAEAEAVTRETCEAVKSCASILELARRNDVDVPITEQVVQVVHNGMAPREMLAHFMARAPKPELGAED